MSDFTEDLKSSNGTTAIAHRLIAVFIVPVAYAVIGYLLVTEIDERKANDAAHLQAIAEISKTLTKVESRAIWNSSEIEARRQQFESIAVLQNDITNIRRILERMEDRITGGDTP